MALMEALRQEIIDAATAAGSRIYPIVPPRTATTPFVVVQQISGTHGHHAGAADGLTSGRWQLRCVADTATAAASLRQAIRDRLDGMTQHPLGSGANTLAVHYIHIDGVFQDFEEPTDGSPSARYVSEQDLLIGHGDTVPTFA